MTLSPTPATTERTPLQADFEPLRPYMIGSPRQFFIWQGATYCARAHPDDLARKNPALSPCQGCPHFAAGCEIAGEDQVEGAYVNKDDGSISGMEPHARRAIGMEQRSFVVLAFKSGHSHATLPKDLWDNPFADKAMNEANLHFLLTNPRTATFHTIKGQLRYYGTEEAFLASPYAAYLDVFDRFEPSHHPVSMDKSAIEPRVCTIVTEEPKWQDVFRGTPKTISREIRFEAPPPSRPRHLIEADGRLFCYLEGELDKADYGKQCKGCPAAAQCRVEVDHLKKVAGDWHSLNAAGFFGEQFTRCDDSYRKKELRGKAKVGGLASIYGGSKYTLSRSLLMTEDEAQRALTNFFSTLAVVRNYMDGIKHSLRTTGTVKNRFQRRRDMRRWSHSQAMDKEGRPDRRQRFRDFGYAERTGLNYPIQGTAADLLKMAMIEIDKMIQSEGWNRLFGLAIPQLLKVGNGAYKDLVFALLSTVHDELLYLIRMGALEGVIPKAYTAMQLQKVMDALRTGFCLELDVEFDTHLAWTAGKGMPTAKIYLLNRLARERAEGRAGPNAAIVALEDCSSEFITACNHPQPDGDLRDFQLAVTDGGKTWVPPSEGFSRAHVERAARATSTRLRLAVI